MGKLTGALARDADRIAIQAGNTFQTKDATGTPKTSPLTVSSVAITFAIPTNCHRIIFYATTNDCRISEESTAAANYFVLKAGQQLTLDVANSTVLYLLRDAGVDAILQFICLTI